MSVWQGPRARRVDIDLLRAVAVLAVVLFHFDVPGFEGGFLGVDIFFVISGYLISLHIQQQLQAGRFSYRTFYLRRIRRLFPAMIATLLLCSVAALVILPRSLLQDFAHSQVASAVYVSNLYFWSVADYFDTDSILKPLLHTWSLSVEEQFYLVWPLFLALTLGRRPRLAMAIALVLSLLAAEWMHRWSSSTAFYLFPFRVFEFAIGALACGVSLERARPMMRHGLLLLAGGTLFGSLLLLDEQTRNPGFATVPVCLATAVIIALRHPWLSVENSLTRPLLRIGLVSYSAYLVHWPLVVFYKIGRPGDLDGTVAVGMMLVTYLLAELLYQGVERPTARLHLRRRAAWLFSSLPAVLALALLVAFTWPRIYPLTHRSQGSLADVLDRIPAYQQVLDQGRTEAAERAQAGLAPDFRRLVVVGDSHAVDLRLALQLTLPPERWYVDIEFSICDPLAAGSFDVPLTELYARHGQTRTHNPAYCDPYHDGFLEALAARQPDVVVFSEAWRRDVLPYLGDSLRALGERLDAEIVVLGRNMQWSGTPEVAFRALDGTQDLESAAWSVRNTNYEDFDDLLQGIAAEAGAVFVSKRELVCPGARCTLLSEGAFTYTDAQHWTVNGMKLYGGRVATHPVFRQALARAGGD